MGIPVSQSLPKISFIAPARDFRTVTGETIGKESVSMLARVMAMGKMHKTFAITAGIPAAIGAVIPGSVVNRVVSGGARGIRGRGDRHRSSGGGDGCEGGCAVRGKGALHRQLYGGPDGPPDHGRSGLRFPACL